MPNSWLKKNLLTRTRLTGFVLLSLAIHFMLVAIHEMKPVSVEKEKGPPPIRVKYVEPEKPKAKDSGRIIDTPAPPKKVEKARTEDLLAKYDSRAHSNANKKTPKTYQRKKTAVPKVKGSRGSKGTTLTREKKVARKPKTRAKIEPRKHRLPESSIGKVKTLTRDKPSPKESSASSRPGTGSVLALLDGFDPEPFASLNTEDLENIDDDEPVSLDTKEVKYASYFARIKHQIERVWIYPSDAARRGISGELNLTFSISRDGNLLGARLLDRSGFEILDVAALKAVKEAAPFYPIPANIKRDKLTIQANFIYTPQFETIEP
jgi:periplasmic protein TonB